MTGKKRACSDAATPKQAVNMENKADTSLHEDCNTYDGIISSLLSQGAQNGKTSRELIQLTGYTRREIQRLVELERRNDGIPILSDSKNGYYLPESDAEIKSFIRGMHRTAREIDKTAKAVENATGIK